MMARLTSRLSAEGGLEGVSFPFLTLLVSGGHCMLLLTKGVGDHQVIGSTLDDALGEAFDKVKPTREATLCIRGHASS